MEPISTDLNQRGGPGPKRNEVSVPTTALGYNSFSLLDHYQLSETHVKSQPLQRTTAYYYSANKNPSEAGVFPLQRYGALPELRRDHRPSWDKQDTQPSRQCAPTCSNISRYIPLFRLSGRSLDRENSQALIDKLSSTSNISKSLKIENR
jgi:hypothetical protein